MSHTLKQLLGVKVPDRLFDDGMKKLEKSTGMSGIDTRLIADIITKSHQIMRSLGLSTHDTTGKELYFSLMSLAGRSDFREVLDDTEYVLANIDDNLISMNIIDVFECAKRKLQYGKQIAKQAQKNLRTELVERYCNHVGANKKTVLEIASTIGLLPDSDAWYNNPNLNRKHIEKLTRSGN